MDLRSLSLPSRPGPSKRDKAPRHRGGERFLRGPIPWGWLCAAAAASKSGAAVKVALALWHLSGLNRQAKTVTLTGKVLRELGVERHAGYRGLEALEAAGLVTVERHPGRRPVVTILEPADTDV